MLVDLVDELRETAGVRVDLGRRLGELRRRNAAAVAADLPLELLLPLERGDVLGALRRRALDERPDVLERGVRLVGSEVTHGPQHRLRRRGRCDPTPELRAPRSLDRPSWPSFAGASYAHPVLSAAHRRSTHVSVYSYSTFAGGMIHYAIWLGVVLLICINRFDLLALRRPQSWRRSLGLAAGVIVAILAWEAIVNALPLPQSPGSEQGITNVHWEPAHAGAFAANVVLFAIVAPFVEELTFRGAGQSLLRFLGRTPSILLVGVAFGLAHGLVEALLVLIPFGIALAWLRDRIEQCPAGDASCTRSSTAPRSRWR